MYKRKSSILFLTLAVAGCVTTPAALPLLQNIQQINPDGSLTPVADKNLTPFQRLLRARLASPLPTSIYSMEVDVPAGDGTEGVYLAVVRHGATAELRYIEQREHLPRVDRYYYRPLTGDEIGELEAFLKVHPLAQLGMRSVVPVEIPATQPAAAIAPIAVPPATMPQTPDDAQAATPVEAAGEEPPATVIRFTDAQTKGSRTVILQSPAQADPAAELVRLLTKYRNTGTFACNYMQSFPPSARLLFGDPHRMVLRIWTRGDDVRAAITTIPIDPAVDDPAGQWFAFADNRWSPAAPPSEITSATEPATAPAPPPVAAPKPLPASLSAPTSAVVPVNISDPQPAPVPAPAPAVAPATQAAAPATEPSRFSLPEMLPKMESWWTEAGPNYTTVWHYVPLSPSNGVRLGFVVPSFIFDDDHMAIDAGRQTLYLIHEGQLFALPIPSRAMRPQ